MYPNATHGYMPFVKPAHKRQAAKKSKVDKAETLKNKSNDMRTYKVTLRDRNGFTFTYIIQTNTASKSNPVLCETRVAGPKTLSSPRMTLLKLGMARRKVSSIGSSTFIKKKTTSNKTTTAKQTAAASKSKRKPKPVFPKKRQRTISAMSNLDPIQESPEEDEDDDFDTDSYSHDSVSSDGSVSES
ncbi:unnamed protein product [Candidula unifasciata]|uniref:Uncharacterized protein n=1 Tax=Candidula unifasciata TaxID=100452 RepID=A0A8S3ZPW8_9EUPU|nr:unnamed protein product [Candidula unifasciata]